MSKGASSVIDALYVKLPFGKAVDLNHALIDQVAQLLIEDKDAQDYKPFDWRDEQHWPGDKESDSNVSQFFALGNSINFRYWWFEENGNYRYTEGTKGGSKERGAHFMWRALKLCFEGKELPILDARKLSRISLDEMKQIFRDDSGSVLMPALVERQRNWRDLGYKLLEYWDGEFYNLIKEAHNSLVEFVKLSRQFRAFDDPLCKMAMVNALMHRGRGIVKFLEPIFPGIDYQLLKQQLRIGILIPKEKLSMKLIHKRILSHDEARELRNAGLLSFLLIMEKTGLAGDIVDNKWWMNRKKCADIAPLCGNCPFENVCGKHVKYGIPLENTRYY